MSTEHAPCAMCGTVRHVEDLDDAMICVNNNCPPGTTGVTPSGYFVTVPREECSPPTCTLTRDEHEGEGHQFGNPCSNGCVCEPDYTQPHQWFQQGNLPEGDPYCSGCQLPRENARHRGAYVATITIHGTNLGTVREEALGVAQFVSARDEDDPIWYDLTLPE